MAKAVRKRKRKRIFPRWRWLLVALAAVAAACWLFPPDISRLPVVRRQLRAWKQIGISAEQVTLTPRGFFHFRGMRVGAAPACTIGRLDLDVSWKELLRGRLSIQHADGDDIIVHWKRLDAWTRSLQAELPASLLAARMTGFDFHGRAVKISELVPGQVVTANRADLRAQFRPEAAVIVQAEGVGDSGRVWARAASFRFRGNPHRFELADLQVDADPLTLSGRMLYGAEGRVLGRVEFHGLDLERWAKPHLPADQIVQGQVQGDASFQADLADPDAVDASGSLTGRGVRLADLPFQSDALIRNYMPALRDVRFDSLRIGHWRLRGRKFFFTDLAARGDPLSVEGNGHVILDAPETGSDGLLWHGALRLDLVGHLQEHYFRGLSALVRGTLYRDTTGAPTFKFRVEGDFAKQNLAVEKLFSRLFKSLSNHFGGKVTSEVPVDTGE